MVVRNNPVVNFDAADAKVLRDFEELVDLFDDEFCTTTNCDRCPHQASCGCSFGADSPYAVAKEVLEFFKGIPTKEG